ncbi:hypothetical protein MTsPCn5_28870 [Croceitalea sp. MTPC5]|nr:hypothetical protein MTsPCn5_28870 [Croceitalea sp. MTPC5]
MKFIFNSLISYQKIPRCGSREGVMIGVDIFSELLLSKYYLKLNTCLFRFGRENINSFLAGSDLQKNYHIIIDL